MARDLRVVLIKLADRHHNLQTMAAVRADKRRRIARETLEIYAPIASRLGSQQALTRSCRIFPSISSIQCARACWREPSMPRAATGASCCRGFSTASRASCARRQHRRAQVFGREKSLYSIYRKMLDKRLSFSQVLDVYGFRVARHRRADCLPHARVHCTRCTSLCQENSRTTSPSRSPTATSRLHTTLIGPHGTPFELQIRTEAMDNLAQEGIASHWLYKDSEARSVPNCSRRRPPGSTRCSTCRVRAGESSEFFEHVKVDLFPHEIYVFTPKGKIIALPRGATPVDLAYAVHTDIGNHSRCRATSISTLMPLVDGAHERRSRRDRDRRRRPSRALAWLEHGQDRPRAQQDPPLPEDRHTTTSRRLLGEKMLDQELRALGVVASEVPVSSWKNVLRDSGNKLIKEVYTDIGLGFRIAGVVARRLLAREEARTGDRQATRLAGHPRHRRHGRAVRPVLPADSR
jgi:guanosine-3',5'-bis(diphosphate) 3'-pyrophosphohydrolase